MSSWPHAPLHRLREAGAYCVTAATYEKVLHFRGDRLRDLHDGLLKYARKHRWELHAWAVFPNHYHFVGEAAQGLPATTLTRFLKEFHSRSARWVNALDETPGRRVWHNYWDTHLDDPKRYYARLAYVHQNAVRHGIVKVARNYPWCSAARFEQTAKDAQVRTVYSFPIDRVSVPDAFDVSDEVPP